MTAPETLTVSSKRPLTTGRRPDRTGVCATAAIRLRARNWLYRPIETFRGRVWRTRQSGRPIRHCDIVLCRRRWSQNDDDISGGLRAADEYVAVRRCIDRIRSMLTVPATSAVSHVWQTPVRHDHRTGTSQASASSSRLSNGAPHRTWRPLRANETCGPAPGCPDGRCGGRCGEAATPGVIDGAAPKISV